MSTLPGPYQTSHRQDERHGLASLVFGHGDRRVRSHIFSFLQDRLLELFTRAAHLPWTQAEIDDLTMVSHTSHTKGFLGMEVKRIVSGPQCFSVSLTNELRETLARRACILCRNYLNVGAVADAPEGPLAFVHDNPRGAMEGRQCVSLRHFTQCNTDLCIGCNLKMLSLVPQHRLASTLLGRLRSAYQKRTEHKEGVTKCPKGKQFLPCEHQYRPWYIKDLRRASPMYHSSSAYRCAVDIFVREAECEQCRPRRGVKRKTPSQPTADPVSSSSSSLVPPIYYTNAALERPFTPTNLFL